MASLPGLGGLDLVGKQLLGRYAIQKQLAQGGMSVIFQALDERLLRPVCVKLFIGVELSPAAYRAAYEHFIQEAFALSRLTHPNILTIFDFGFLDEPLGNPFQVSELMEGGTLAGLIRSHGPLPIGETLEILEAIGSALIAAHAAGILHRDIKPTNILFGAAGPNRVVKLADFGIAKAFLDGGDRPLPNRAQDTGVEDGQRIMMYSPGWAAPEQLRGRRPHPRRTWAW